MSIIQILFGAGTWGAGGNMVAWVLCGIPAVAGFLWHHRRQIRKEFAAIHQKLDAGRQELPAGQPSPPPIPPASASPEPCRPATSADNPSGTAGTSAGPQPAAADSNASTTSDRP